MVQKICKIIEEHCEEGVFPELFRSCIYSNPNFSYIQGLIQQTSNEKGFKLPNRVDLYRNKISKDSIDVRKRN